MSSMSNNSSFEETVKENQFDLKEFFEKLQKYWWYFPFSLLFCLSVALVYLRYATPVYKISAKILVEDEKKGGGGLNANAVLGEMSTLFDAKSNVDNEVEILKTRLMAEKAVKTMNLHIIYYRIGKIKDQELYHAPFIVEPIDLIDSLRATTYDLTVLDSDHVLLTYKDKESGEQTSVKMQYGHPVILKYTGVIKILANPRVPYENNLYRFHITSVDVAASKLKKDLTISVTNKLVTTVDIELEHPLPKMGEAILNKFIEGYMEQSVLEKNRIADSTITFIENRLIIVSDELGDIEGNIQKFKQNNDIADISEQSKLLVGNTSGYSKELSDLETRMSIIEALQEYLSLDKNKKVVPNSALAQDEVFGKLVQGYNELLLERERQLISSTEENPYIVNLDQRIKSLRNSMLSNLASTKHSLQISINQLEKKLSQLKNEIHKIPANERTYLGMFRQQLLKQELYLFLLKKREETAVSKTSNFSNAKIIDYPKSELIPHSPNRKVILLGALLLSLLAPLAIIYVKGMLNTKIQSKEDILKVVNISVIGEISHTKSEEDYIYKNPKSIIAEQFRGLRTNLSFFLNSNKKETILLTSSMMGEGKTFTSINLGTALAISDKKVLLVDLDLRKASLSAKLGVKDKLGFTNCIISDTGNEGDYIVPLTMYSPNLSILAAGPIPPNPAEILMHKKTGDLIRKLQEQYDYIILDAPPVGIVTDAQLLGQYASITLYLVRENYTFKHQMDILRDLVFNGKMSKVSVILNDISATGKTYTYGDYGNNAAPKANWLSKIINISKRSVRS